ncbi:MAG: hypothetical protein M1819_004916 [Sarea resinae]|nr:MAG: hypothetical protein M1819_004916 [Sarea resinae]
MRNLPTLKIWRKRYCFRRSACRALSTSSSSILSKPRSISTISPLVLRASRQSNILLQQRRWASDEAELKAKEAATATESVPTPSTSEPKASPVPSSADSDDHSTVASAVSSASSAVSAKVSDAAGSAAETAESAKETVTDAAETAARATRFAPPEQEQRSIFVANLPWTNDEEDLKELFSEFGRVEKVIMPLRDGKRRGFAIVELADAATARKAVDGANGQAFNGRDIVVQLANRRPTTPRTPALQRNAPSDTIFLGNLSYEMSDQDLNELFHDVDNVTDVRVAIDRRTGQARGFLHAEFTDEASATKAHKYFRGKEIHGRRIKVDYGKPSTGRKQPSTPAPEPTEN